MSLARTSIIPPTGVFAASPTFFQPKADSSGFQAELDIATQVRHTIFLANNGVRGVVLLGSVGEAVHLNRAERRSLIAGVRAGLNEAKLVDFPLMAGVLTNGLDDAVEWLHDSAEAGAQWGMVLVPGYFGQAADQKNLIEWFTLVADRSPIPILIYNFPAVTNDIWVTPDTYRVLAQHPNIVGCKLSHGNTSHHVQISLDPEIDHSSFRAYAGFVQQLGPVVHFGCAGVIEVLVTIYPKAIVRLMELAEERSPSPKAFKELQRLQWVVSRAQEYVGKTGFRGVKEAVKRVTGMGTLEGGRPPLQGRLPEDEWETLHHKYLGPLETIEAGL